MEVLHEEKHARLRKKACMNGVALSEAWGDDRRAANSSTASNKVKRG